MCVIIHKPAGVKLPEATVKDAFIQNPDGLGFFVIGTDNAMKGYMSYHQALVALKDAKALEKHNETIIHCRIGTSGKKDAYNTHPFCTKHGLLFHNGVIQGLGTAKQSDTWELSKLLDRMSYKDAIALLEILAVNTGSRFALVDRKVKLIGNYLKHDGLTVSNTNFVKLPVTYSYNIPSSEDWTARYKCAQWFRS